MKEMKPMADDQMAQLLSRIEHIESLLHNIAGNIANFMIQNRIPAAPPPTPRPRDPATAVPEMDPPSRTP